MRGQQPFHGIMRSANRPEQAENRGYKPTTPHNPALRIIGPTHKNAVAGCFVVGGVGFRDDADAFGLQAEGDDFAPGSHYRPS